MPERKRPGSVPGDRDRTPATALRIVKTVHTVVWAFFVSMIAAIWALAAAGRPAAAAWPIAVVLIEVAVLAANRWRCPLTAIAARHTPDRRANFDIHLPAWLAARTMPIFAPLYLGGVVFTIVRVVQGAG